MSLYALPPFFQVVLSEKGWHKLLPSWHCCLYKTNLPRSFRKQIFVDNCHYPNQIADEPMGLFHTFSVSAHRELWRKRLTCTLWVGILKTYSNISELFWFSVGFFSVFLISRFLHQFFKRFLRALFQAARSECGCYLCKQRMAVRGRLFYTPTPEALCVMFYNT